MLPIVKESVLSVVNGVKVYRFRPDSGDWGGTWFLPRCWRGSADDKDLGIVLVGWPCARWSGPVE